MARRNMKLPKEQILEPEDKTGFDTDDVEGHGLPLTPPPVISQRGPGHGGEAIPMPEDEDDVEGHIPH